MLMSSRIFRGYDFSIFIISLSLERYYGVLTQTFEPASVCLVMECPPGKYDDEQV